MRNLIMGVSFFSLLLKSRIQENNIESDDTPEDKRYSIDITDEFINILKASHPYKKNNSNIFFVTEISKEKEDQLREIFATGRIFNTSNYEIRIDGKTYFTILKSTLEVLLENDKAMKNLIKGSGDDKESIKKVDYLKVLLNFVYYTLYVTKGNVSEFYKKIDINKDCGSIGNKELLELFFKCLILNVIGNETNFSNSLEEYPNVFSDLKDTSDNLNDYKDFIIEVVSHTFGSSYTTVRVHILDYIFAAIEYTLNNTLQFMDRLPTLIPEDKQK